VGRFRWLPPPSGEPLVPRHHRRRQTFAEESYLVLYRSLAHAPDLGATLNSVASGLDRAALAEAELPLLRRQLADFEDEFASLKSQEHTIKVLQQQLREAEAAARCRSINQTFPNANTRDPSPNKHLLFCRQGYIPRPLSTPGH